MQISKSANPGNRRRLHEHILGLQRAGKTDREISDLLGVTHSTIRYLASLYETPGVIRSPLLTSGAGQRQELAHEMWREGKSVVEIGEMLQVSTIRARQILHKYSWGLRRS
jgi:predicted transcriptional regulator